MWTAEEVAARVPLEVLDHLKGVTVGAKSGLAFDQKLEMAGAKIPIPEPAALLVLLETAFDASLTFDEGRPCTMLLRYRTQGAPGRYSAFEVPQPVTVESLRRLSPAVGTARASSLLFCLADGVPMIIGLDLSPKADIQKSFAVRVTGPGRMDIEWANARLVTCRPDGVSYASDSDAFTGAFAAELTEALTVSSAMPKLGASVERIRDSGHGGSIWVLPPGDEISHKDLSVGYRMSTDVPNPDPALDGPDLVAHLHLLADVAALDGAVLIDRDLNLIGFGAFMDVISGAAVDVFVPGGGFRAASDSEIGGGRHRSAAAFCQEHRKGMAVVISQDGGISVLASARERARAGPVPDHRPRGEVEQRDRGELSRPGERRDAPRRHQQVRRDGSTSGPSCRGAAFAGPGSRQLPASLRR